MYYFKKEKKDEILQGRTITYVANNFLYRTKSFVSAVLSGKRGCSYKSARDIVNIVGTHLDLNNYFYEDKTKPIYVKNN